MKFEEIFDLTAELQIYLVYTMRCCVDENTVVVASACPKYLGAMNSDDARVVHADLSCGFTCQVSDAHAKAQRGGACAL